MKPQNFFGILMQLILWFLERQIKKWGAQIDWEQVKLDACERMAQLMPGELLDEPAQNIVRTMIDLFSALFIENKGLEKTDPKEQSTVAMECFQAASSQLNWRLAGASPKVK